LKSQLRLVLWWQLWKKFTFQSRWVVASPANEGITAVCICSWKPNKKKFNHVTHMLQPNREDWSTIRPHLHLFLSLLPLHLWDCFEVGEVTICQSGGSSHLPSEGVSHLTKLSVIADNLVYKPKGAMGQIPNLFHSHVIMIVPMNDMLLEVIWNTNAHCKWRGKPRQPLSVDISPLSHLFGCGTWITPSIFFLLGFHEHTIISLVFINFYEST
jgi:hypothetical protein